MASSSGTVGRQKSQPNSQFAGRAAGTNSGRGGRRTLAVGPEAVKLGLVLLVEVLVAVELGRGAELCPDRRAGSHAKRQRGEGGDGRRRRGEARAPLVMFLTCLAEMHPKWRLVASGRDEGPSAA